MLASRACIHRSKPAGSEEDVPVSRGSRKVTSVPEGFLAGKGREPAEAQALIRSGPGPPCSVLGSTDVFSSMVFLEGNSSKAAPGKSSPMGALCLLSSLAA